MIGWLVGCDVVVVGIVAAVAVETLALFFFFRVKCGGN